MESIMAREIRETMLAGRTIEARAMLIGASDTISVEERSGLAQELLRLQTEIERLLASAEALEKEGRIDEAKAACLAARQLSSDFPGIDEEIKRLDESQQLARAVQHRNQRTREAGPEKIVAAAWSQRIRPLAPALAAAVGVLLLGFLLLRGNGPTVPQQPSQTPTVQETVSGGQPTPPPAAAKQTGETLPAAPATPAAEGQSPPVDAGATKPASVLYTVRPGDSLSIIATRELCRQPAWEEIYERNRDLLADPTKLQPGMQLRLDGIENSCGQAR